MVRLQTQPKAGFSVNSDDNPLKLMKRCRSTFGINGKSLPALDSKKYLQEWIDYNSRQYGDFSNDLCPKIEDKIREYLESQEDKFSYKKETREIAEFIPVNQETLDIPTEVAARRDLVVENEHRQENVLIRLKKYRNDNLDSDIKLLEKEIKKVKI